MKEHFIAQDLTERHQESEKSVEVTELFYDLVYVYAIAQISHIILHGQNGDIPSENFLKFIVMTLIFYTVWSYQTSFMNRFGLLRIKDLFFLMSNMFIAIFLAISLKKDFTQTFDPINVCISILFLLTGLQFFLALTDKIKAEDRFAAKIFGSAMMIGALLSSIAVVLPPDSSYYCFGAAILTAILFPLPFRKRLKAASINVPHMVERYTLLTIIMFGETIIGLTKIFKIEHFSFNYFTLFLIIISLFGSYWLLTNRLIHQERYASGLTLTLSHFFILIGLGMINASLILDAKDDISNSFKIELMFAALICYFGGMLMNLNYSHDKFNFDRQMIMMITAILFIGFIIAYYIQDISYSLPVTTVCMTTAIYFVYSYFYRFKYPDEAK